MRWNADAIITDLEQEPVLRHLQPDLTRLRLGMANDVGEGLLHDPERRDFDRCGERREIRLGAYVHAEATVAALFGLLAQRRQQTELVERRWPERVHVPLS